MTAKLKLTLESWMRTGAVGSLRVGDSTKALVRTLGTTKIVGPKPNKSIPGYWLYGVVEFGISYNGLIEWIQSDTVNIESDLTESGFIDLDWQGVYHHMPLDQCVEWLSYHGLAHDFRVDDDGAMITVENNIQLLLTDVSAPKLVTVWCPPMLAMGPRKLPNDEITTG